MLLEIILAIIPIAWLIISMAGLKMAGYKSCGIGLVIAIVEGVAVYHMTVPEAITGTLEGVVSAVWPICVIIVGAMFLYNMSLRTGAMDVIKAMLASVSNDKRVAALVIGWGFSNFMEGIAGFGTAVAIPAAMLVALGFNPVTACVICLIGNAASPEFGAIGTPTLSAANTAFPTTITGAADASVFAQMLSEPTARLLIPLCVVSPFVIILLCGGTKALKGVVGITLVSALSFVIPFYLVATFVGPELCVVIGSLVCLVCTIVMGRKHTNIPEEYMLESKKEAASSDKPQMSMVKAWLPYILVVIFLLGTSKLVPPINQFLGQFKSSLVIYCGEGGAKVGLSWINTPGILMIIATIIGTAVQGASISDMGAELGKTFKGYWKAMLTVIFIISIAKVMGYAGMVMDLANALSSLLGNAYIAIAPLIGGIGCFVTGSATSASVMFATLQQSVAQQLGINEIWLVAANGAGATAGKMISPQSIALGVAAINLPGSDGKIMSKTIGWCVLYLVILCVFCFVGA